MPKNKILSQTAVHKGHCKKTMLIGAHSTKLMRDCSEQRSGAAEEKLISLAIWWLMMTRMNGRKNESYLKLLNKGSKLSEKF